MDVNIKHISILIKEYDEAISFYVEKLGFELVEDTRIDAHKRWVLVKPKGSSGFSLLLAKASNDRQKQQIGNQTGGRVFLFLHTDNFEREYQNLLDRNIKIIREAVTEPHGKVAVFEDLYGNLWDLIEPFKKSTVDKMSI